MRDSQRGAIPKAEVAVVSDETGVTQRTRTNNLESWTVLYLLPSSYHLLISAPGFETLTRNGVELQVPTTRQWMSP